MNNKIVFILIFYFWSTGSIEYTVDNYPNPTQDFALCGRPSPSWICDPDSIIDFQTANEIQDILYNIHQTVPSSCKLGGYQVAVAIMSKFHVPSTNNAEDQAKKMAKELHHRWKVGHVGCNNGILFLLSKEDRKMYISTGEGVKHVLTNQLIANIIEEMKSGLREGEFSATIKNAIIDIQQILSGNLPPSNNNTSLTILVPIIIFTILYCCCNPKKTKKIDCKYKLSLIERQAKAKFKAIMCPICLEELSKLPKEILDCGHTFCKPCISKWHEINLSCPICRSEPDIPPTHNKELQFHLNSLNRIYPDYVPLNMVNMWANPSFDGDFVISNDFGTSDSFDFGGGDIGDFGDGGGGDW